jgi:hypothetical protein
MDTATLLRTALVALSLFGFPLLALIWSWRRDGTPPAGEDGGGREYGRALVRGAYDPISRWE